MALWNNTDEDTSAPQYTVDITTGNTGVQAYNVEPVGTWGVDTDEARATNVNGHAGWVLRTVGSGGRDGRVTEETLVAMGSMTGDGDDDTVYPDAIITIVTQPSSVTANTGDNVSFTVVATSTPTTTLAYQWTGPQGDVGTDSATLTINDIEAANAGGYNVTVSADGADDVTSANATLTINP
jgi:hypothetical protein